MEPGSSCLLLFAAGKQIRAAAPLGVMGQPAATTAGEWLCVPATGLPDEEKWELMAMVLLPAPA